MSVLREERGAFPVYMRPDLQFDNALPVPGAEFIGLDQRDVEVAPGDNSSARAAQAARLEPVLSITEADRRQKWQVSADIRTVLRDLHVQFGHPTTTTMMRILRRMNAKPEVIYAAQLTAAANQYGGVGQSRQGYPVNTSSTATSSWIPSMPRTSS